MNRRAARVSQPATQIVQRGQCHSDPTLETTTKGAKRGLPRASGRR
jgi:hypothetical protein